MDGVSIIICTHNNAFILPIALARLRNQQASIPWEVIVVDNASTDRTSEVARTSWGIPVTSLRVVREDQLGLSFARARGIKESKYDIACFVDDDNWLDENYIQTVYEILSTHPEVAACGGRIDGVFEGPEPEWFDELKSCLACGEQSSSTGYIAHLYGAGMAVRKAAWEQLEQRGFKSLLTDRKGKSLTCGGDTELSFALRLLGYKLWYDERLQMQHFQSKNRLSYPYLRRWHWGFGKATVGVEPYVKALGENDSLTSSWKREAWLMVKTVVKNINLGYRLYRSPDGQSLYWYSRLSRLVALLKARSQYDTSFQQVKSLSK